MDTFWESADGVQEPLTPLSTHQHVEEGSDTTPQPLLDSGKRTQAIAKSAIALANMSPLPNAFRPPPPTFSFDTPAVEFPSPIGFSPAMAQHEVWCSAHSTFFNLVFETI